MPKKRIWLFAIFIAALLVLIIFAPSLLLNLKNLSQKIFLSPLELFSKTNQYFYSKGILNKENAKLRKDISDLTLEINQYKALKNENERLRALLDFKGKVKFNTISAEVVSRDPNDWLGSFIINKGSLDGLKINAAVCSSQGLLGVIVEVKDHTSSVMLITHPNFRSGGMLEDSRINGIVVGSGKDSLRMLYLPMGEEIQQGSIVITSGFSRLFPKGLVIGMVLSTAKSETGLYQYAVIKPAATLYKQEEVLCLK